MTASRRSRKRRKESVAGGAPTAAAEPGGGTAPAAGPADPEKPPAPAEAREYDVAVVGAGAGGLAAAALLARAGRSVILLDRAPQAGGACRELTLDGVRCELGASLLTGLDPGGPVEALCQGLGIALPASASDPAFQVTLPTHRINFSLEPDRWWSEIRRELPEDEAGWRALLSELEILAGERDRAVQDVSPLPPDGWRARLRVWCVRTRGSLFGARAQGWRRLQQGMATPFRETLLRHGLSPASRQILDAVLWYLLLRTAEECSTLEAALALQRLGRGVAAVPGGAMALVEALVAQFGRDGGHLRLGTEVARCLLERGRVAGVVTEEGETIRARWVVSDVPPPVLVGRLLPPRHGWFRRPRAADGPWLPTHVAQALALVLPEAMLPSELAGHCFIIPDAARPAREENLVFVRTPPPRADGEGPPGLRGLCLGRFVTPRAPAEAASVRGSLLAALDQIIPGVEAAMVSHQVLTAEALAEVWGRPQAAVRYGVESRGWLGRRGMPHGVGRPGLLVVGEWSYPGRLVYGAVEGAMQAVGQILGER